MRSYTNDIIKVKQGSIITLQQAKEQLNVEEDFLEDNEHILFLIEAATSAAEDYAGIDINSTLNTLEFIEFYGDSIQIKEAPYKSITSITVTVDGIDTVLNSGLYTVQRRKTDFIIIFNENIEADKLVVVFVTGWLHDEAPASIISAILVKINDLYDIERTSYTVGANFRDNKTFTRLLGAYCINRW
jgi:hypothetical protein